MDASQTKDVTLAKDAIITIYAKNMAGEIMSMAIYPQASRGLLRLCLADLVGLDPSRVILLRLTRRLPDVPMNTLTEDGLPDFLEELHEMAKEEEEDKSKEDESEDEDEEEEEEEEEWGDLQDGDIVEYLVRDPDLLCVHMMAGMRSHYGGAYRRDPFYVINITVKHKFTILYKYYFLFRPLTGTFHPSSAWEIEEDDTEDTHIIFHSPTAYSSIHEMLMGEKEKEDIPLRYLERMCRAVGRKWIRILRRMMKFSAVRQRSPRRSSRATLDDTQLWKKHYWAAKGKNSRMSEK